MPRNELPALGQTGPAGGTSSGAGSIAHPYSTANAGRRQAPILIYHEGRRVASVVGSELRITIRSTKGHVLTCAPGPGLALNLDVLENARRAGAVALCITDADTGRRYRATLAAFRAHSIPFDFGYGLQRCLPFGFWQIEEPGASQPGLGL